MGGSQKGGFQKGGFGGCSPGTKTGTRVRSPKPPFYETALLSPSEPLGADKRVVRKRVVSADVPQERKPGTRVRSPKPPFYETALLSPSEFRYHETRDLGAMLKTILAKPTPHSPRHTIHPYPKDPPVLKTLQIVNLLSAVPSDTKLLRK